MPNGFHTPPFGWDGEIRPANRAALAAARPWAWRRILDGLPAARRPDAVARPGQPFNLALDDQLLHAPRDPLGVLAEAARVAVPRHGLAVHHARAHARPAGTSRRGPVVQCENDPSVARSTKTQRPSSTAREYPASASQGDPLETNFRELMR